ncbi:MAG: DUF4294 domain-containing protein, partial [Flavobacteriales bacterium]|nr:DUF4294 domain-containing protein [Flavobacteriales bacterium]
MKNLLYISGLILTLSVSAQTSNEIVDAASVDKEALYNGVVARATVVDGDTIPMVILPVYKKMDNRVFKSNAERRKYTRLVRKVRKVYPFAKLAGEKLRGYNDTLLTIKDEGKKKKFMKKVEKEIQDEYGGKIRDLTISEGRILIRLIDRETGNTSYALVEELRGQISAVF